VFPTPAHSHRPARKASIHAESRPLAQRCTEIKRASPHQGTHHYPHLKLLALTAAGLPPRVGARGTRRPPWAQSAGRAIPNGPGVTPRPGDLIVFGDEHVGIVRGALPNGDVQTIEGNWENKVAANVRKPSEATGYVNMS
jgi:hypothetical protein